jgi:hypothetical protein
MLLIPPLGLFASSAGPLGSGGAIIRVGRRLPRDLPPQFPSASTDRIEHGATSRRTAIAVHNCSISSLAPEKASASGDLWPPQTTVTNRRSSAAGRPSEEETTNPGAVGLGHDLVGLAPGMSVERLTGPLTWGVVNDRAHHAPPRMPSSF